MRQKVTLVLLMAVFVLGLGCSGFPIIDEECDPNDQGGPKMKVEYDYQEDYEIGWMEGLYDNVKGAFDFVGTDIQICRDSSFAVDSLFRISGLSSFFYENKSSGLIYYLVSARGLQENQGPGWKRWGVTIASAPNVPPNPKWSYIFVGDISEEYYGGQWTKHRTVAYTTIHELGHQRAGLTHPGLHPQYHQATYPCIMDTNVSNEVLNAMNFCWSSDSTSADNCRYFLRQQNQE